MPQLFWSGKLTLPMRLLIEANNLLSLLTGSFGDARAMKQRVRAGYEGAFSDHVRQYDALGYHLQDKSARSQLEGFDLQGKHVLDVGCGTGALARVAFENGARRVVCGDISALMLDEAKRKDESAPRDGGFCQLDAESLPFVAGAFDAVISGMVFGTLPGQKQAVAEMVRAARPGGLVCIGAHGPDHYWEAIDATLRCIDKRYVLGYRFEWWPRSERDLRRLLEAAGLEDVRTRRFAWQTQFASGAAAYDFFAAISSSWWYARFPPDARIRDSQRTRAYFDRNQISVVTDDIVVAYGYRPPAGARPSP
jgi:SAM-dependent methyltransferase